MHENPSFVAATLTNEQVAAPTGRRPTNDAPGVRNGIAGAVADAAMALPPTMATWVSVEVPWFATTSRKAVSWFATSGSWILIDPTPSGAGDTTGGEPK